MSKTEAQLAEKMKKLQEEKRQLIKAKNLALGVEVSRAIKAGNLDLNLILESINKTTKSKKNRTLLNLDERFNENSQTPPPLPENTSVL